MMSGYIKLLIFPKVKGISQLEINQFAGTGCWQWKRLCVWGQGYMGTLYFLLYFAVNLKLL